MCVDPFAVLLVYVFGIAHSVNYGLFMRKWTGNTKMATSQYGVHTFLVNRLRLAR